MRRGVRGEASEARPPAEPPESGRQSRLAELPW